MRSADFGRGEIGSENIKVGGLREACGRLGMIMLFDDILNSVGRRHRDMLRGYAADVLSLADDIRFGETDFFSLWVGYALGKGLPVDEATDYEFYKAHVEPLEHLEKGDLVPDACLEYRTYLNGKSDPRD